MRHSQRKSVVPMCVAVLMLGLIFSSCSGTSASTAEHGVAASTATAVSTATNDPLPPPATPDPASLEQKGCPAVALGPVPVQYGTVDGLKVSIPRRDSSDDFPSELMPNNESNAPHRVPLTVAETAQVGAFRPNPPVNPSLATGYGLQVCNQTTATHTITKLSVNIAGFTPSSGPVTIWHICQDGPYDTATRMTTPGCGGDGHAFVDIMEATLPAARTGATAPVLAATVGTAPFQSSGTNLPITLRPNESLLFLIAVNGLTSQGTYALSFGVSIDGAPPTAVAPSDGPFLIAPAAIVWTGTACQTPAMQALIPPDTFYVCPPTP